MAKNEVATKVGMATYLTNPAVKKQITDIVGNKASQTFISSIVSAVQTNPTLAECTNTSILSGALLGESLHLSPSPQLGNYYLVPYKDKTGKSSAQFQIGYKGLIQLAIRSGEYRKIIASEVKEGELASFNPITEEFELNPVSDIAKRGKLKTIGYYAMFELNNGYRKDMYWTKEQMESHALRFSAGYKAKKGYTFWEKDFDAMAKKTMLRQIISKWGIMSIDMQRGYEADMGVIGDDGSIAYVDETTTESNVEAEIANNASSVVVDIDAVEVVDAN